MTPTPPALRFYGWRVVQAAFVLALFGWGIGFYGPPVFLSVLHETRGWPVFTISAAISVHFLLGAVTGANLYNLHRRLGVAATTHVGAASMALGLAGWGWAAAPWQLFIAAALTGVGWANMSAAALNAIVSPWFDRARPMALGMAYNGGSVGGIIFSPLWVLAIAAAGMPLATTAVAVLVLMVVGALAQRVFRHTPASLNLAPDGDAPGAAAPVIAAPWARPLPGALLWRNRMFLTLAAAMTLGLFAQIGLIAHLYSLLVKPLGAQPAGLAMALITVMAIAGRLLLGKFMPLSADRRLIGCAGYLFQLAGSLAFLFAHGESVPLLIAGVVLFGIGFGNANSLPPLIAQAEFVKADMPRVASLLVGIAQGGYCVAPAFFGLIREATTTPTAIFAAAAAVQGLAVVALLAGRRGA